MACIEIIIILMYAPFTFWFQDSTIAPHITHWHCIRSKNAGRIRRRTHTEAMFVINVIYCNVTLRNPEKRKSLKRQHRWDRNLLIVLYANVVVHFHTSTISCIIRNPNAAKHFAALSAPTRTQQITDFASTCEPYIILNSKYTYTYF